MSVSPKILVLCLGNPDRGDDAIGSAVAQALEGRLPAPTQLQTRSGDMLSLIEDWEGVDALICVDATAPLDEPGRIRRFDVTKEGLPVELGSVSSHAFGLGQVIALAQSLRLAPAQIIVYGIEGQCFEAGAPISPGPLAAILPATEQVLAEASKLIEEAPYA